MEEGIREKVAALAARFAEEVIGVISASIATQLSSAGAARARGERGRGIVAGRPSRVRRSASQLGAISDRIVGELGKRPDGVRAEELRASLGLARSAMARPIAHLLASKRIRKTGEKRRTTYFLGSSSGGSAKRNNGAAGKRRGGKSSKKGETPAAAQSAT